MFRFVSLIRARLELMMTAPSRRLVCSPSSGNYLAGNAYPSLPWVGRLARFVSGWLCGGSAQPLLPLIIIIIIIRHQLLLLDLFRVASRGNMSTSKTAKLANNFRVKNEKKKENFGRCWLGEEKRQGQGLSIFDWKSTHKHTSKHTHTYTQHVRIHIYLALWNLIKAAQWAATDWEMPKIWHGFSA